jgi:hypothetical protein
MICRKGFLSSIAIALLIGAPLVASANQQPQSHNATTVVTTGTPLPSFSISDLLPEKLAGVSATGEIKQYASDALSELAADKAAGYQEYKITLAASRLYGANRVEVFKTENPYAAFGLYSYIAKDNAKKLKTRQIGAHSAFVANSLVFWKRSYLIKVTNGAQGGAAESLQTSLASAVNDRIPAGQEPVEPPILFNSLPKNSLVAESEKYFLGPEALNAHVAGARDRFSFDGKAEAAVAEYRKTPEAGAKPLKLVIVEYHTPQFATDAMNRLNGFVATLSEEERGRFLVKRVGNFLVGATNFEDREFAESLINTVEYPYVVKWLQNPAIPTNDPFAVQKAGQMLVSTFSLIGLSGGVMLLCGTIMGTTIFLRRRKQQRATFSDAGGMIGLHLDPIEESLLSLPAPREE